MDQYLVSTVVIVSFLLGCCLLAIVKNASKLTSAQRLSVFALLGFFVFWVILSWYLALKGFYLKKEVLQFLPMLVNFVLTTSMLAGILIYSKTLRKAVTTIVFSVPFSWLYYIHFIRAGAFGSIQQYFNGELPGHFVIPVAFPDFFIGITAPIMGYLISRRQNLPKSLVMIWHGIGILLIVIAGIMIHASVPSSIQMFFDGPTMTKLYQFPLVLVPTFFMPFFSWIHFAAIYRHLKSS